MSISALQVTREAATREFWRVLMGTLRERQVLRARPRQGGYVLPEARCAFSLPDRVIFVLDMQRLGGIPREMWLKHPIWKQWRAALDGRPVFVTDSAGLAVTVGREPLAPASRSKHTLPARILLTAAEIPDAPYCVRLGYDEKNQPLDLNLAQEQRAILMGGASGYGKTNTMKSFVMQLATKHTLDEIRFAIVDTKEVDFTGSIAHLPQLFTSIAYTLTAAEELIERVEAERVRRQRLMHQAQVSDWQQYNAKSDVPFPLLLLIVDEAADFKDDMATLINIARKGRAFGISLVLGTQRPDSKVISGQVTANLPTAIAFRTRTNGESRVILDRAGAEDLTRPGQALIFSNGWLKVQTLLVTDIEAFIHSDIHVQAPTLTDAETFLVCLAQEEYGGVFNIQRLYEDPQNVTATGYRVSKRQITKLAQRWEKCGWLTQPIDVTQPRQVTAEILSLTYPPLRPQKVVIR